MSRTEAPRRLEDRHIKALLAFGETAFGPAELDDDHDEALEILRRLSPENSQGAEREYRVIAEEGVLVEPDEAAVMGLEQIKLCAVEYVEEMGKKGVRVQNRPVGPWSDVDESPENSSDGFEHCKRCGRGNTVWFAPSPLWNAVMRGGSIDGDPIYNDLVCATCFMEIAEEKGIASVFKVYAEQVNVELETTTPSGRVWDEKRGLWTDPDKNSSGVEEVESLTEKWQEAERLCGVACEERDAAEVELKDRDRQWLDALESAGLVNGEEVEAQPAEVAAAITVSTQPVSPQPDPTTRLSEGSDDA